MDHGMETAAAHLGGQPSEIKPMKEFHAKELHDGTYHVMMHHGDPMKPPMEGSAHDVDGVVDHMMHHFGGEGGGEEEGGKSRGEGAKDKKEGREGKPSEKAVKPTSEKAEKPGGAAEDEE